MRADILRIAWLSVIGVLLALAVAAQSQAAGRNALVIGNSSYRPGYELRNPIADARGMADSLAAVGFDVIVLEDTDLISIQHAVDAFVPKALSGEAAVIYYAGHGARIANRDFLLPVDFQMTNFDNIDSEAFDVERLLQALSSTHAGLKLLFFDACRNNPLEDRGAVPLQEPAPSRQYGANTMTVYATAQGMTALDGAGQHSPFAEAMMTNLASPNTELSDLIRLVTIHVRDKTAGRQTTYLQGSLDRDFFLGQYQGTRGVVSRFSAIPAVTTASLVFPNSDTEVLLRDQLAGKDAATLRLARNEIFARHGRKFATAALRDHFMQFDWYDPQDTETPLNQTELRNVELIREYELKAGLPAGDFVFPDSDRRLLVAADLEPLSKEQLRIARNEIYARRGWPFQTPEMKAHFEKFEWYVRNAGKVELSHIEQQNVDFIRRFEK